jgi:hypothetical protein
MRRAGCVGRNFPIADDDPQPHVGAFREVGRRGTPPAVHLARQEEGLPAVMISGLATGMADAEHRHAIFYANLFRTQDMLRCFGEGFCQRHLRPALPRRQQIRVTFMGRWTTLHAMWDSGVLAPAVLGDERGYALRLERSIKPGDID